MEQSRRAGRFSTCHYVAILEKTLVRGNRRNDGALAVAARQLFARALDALRFSEDAKRGRS